MLEQCHLGIHVHQYLHIRPVRNLPLGNPAAPHGVIDAAVHMAPRPHLVRAIQVARVERDVVEIGRVAGVKPLGTRRLAVGMAPQVDELRIRGHVRPVQDSNAALVGIVGHRLLQPGADPFRLSRKVPVRQHLVTVSAVPRFPVGHGRGGQDAQLRQLVVGGLVDAGAHHLEYQHTEQREQHGERREEKQGVPCEQAANAPLLKAHRRPSTRSPPRVSS